MANLTQKQVKQSIVKDIRTDMRKILKESIFTSHPYEGLGNHSVENVELVMEMMDEMKKFITDHPYLAWIPDLIDDIDRWHGHLRKRRGIEEMELAADLFYHYIGTPFETKKKRIIRVAAEARTRRNNQIAHRVEDINQVFKQSRSPSRLGWTREPWLDDNDNVIIAHHARHMEKNISVEIDCIRFSTQADAIIYLENIKESQKSGPVNYYALLTDLNLNFCIFHLIDVIWNGKKLYQEQIEAMKSRIKWTKNFLRNKENLSDRERFIFTDSCNTIDKLNRQAKVL